MKDAAIRFLVAAAIIFTGIAGYNYYRDNVDPRPDDVITEDVAGRTHKAVRDYLDNLADLAKAQADLPEEDIPDTVTDAMKPIQDGGDTARAVLRGDLAKIMHAEIGKTDLDKKKFKALLREMEKGFRK